MIDILQKRSQENPNQIFIKYENVSITYRQFNNMVLNIMEDINHINLHYIGIQINNKIKLLVLISALNRLNKIPVIYPYIPNIEDYTQAINIPISIMDNNIKLNKQKNKLNKKFNYNKGNTQIVMFTSGTTGTPKACELTYNNIHQSAIMWNNIINFKSNDIYLNHMPLSHVSGLSIFYRALYSNFSMVIDDFDAIKYLNIIKTYKITIISMVPSMLQKITNAKVSLNKLSQIKAIIMGGSDCDKNLIQLIKKHNLPVYMSYGMTETCSGIAGYWIKHQAKYLPHNNVHINVDKSCLVINSPTIMQKYINHKKTNNIIKTNDICKIYDDNTFEIKGRDDEVIISGGENISIKYLKNHIETYPEIKKCTLQIVSDQKWGSVLHAILQCNGTINRNNLLEKLKNNLPKYMIPKRIIIQ